MNIYEFFLPILILIVFVVACLPLFRHFFVLCIPFGLSMFAILKGFYGEFDPIYFIIPALVAFITLLLLIHKSIEGDLI